jgi:hypothetical protein
MKEWLGPVIQEALTQRPGLIYTEEWLAAIAYQETGPLLHRYIAREMEFDDICTLMRGSYSRRNREPKKRFHGFSFWQLDMGSYTDFLLSGDWKHPFRSCLKLIDILEKKRKFLVTRCRLKGDELCQAITAAYDCGQGNVIKAIKNDLPIDHFTYRKNYSTEIWKVRQEYLKLKINGPVVNRPEMNFLN